MYLLLRRKLTLGTMFGSSEQAAYIPAYIWLKNETLLAAGDKSRMFFSCLSYIIQGMITISARKSALFYCVPEKTRSFAAQLFGLHPEAHHTHFSFFIKCSPHTTLAISRTTLHSRCPRTHGDCLTMETSSTGTVNGRLFSDSGLLVRKHKPNM